MANHLNAGWSDRFGSPVVLFGQRTAEYDKPATTIGESDRSVADTIALMSVHTNSAAKTPQIARALEDAGCLEPSLTEDEVISRVFTYIKQHVTFVEDDSQLAEIFQVRKSRELLITPPVLLSMREPQGDCDDFSMLCCAMLMACGVSCHFITVAADRAQPMKYSHVYCLAVTSDGREIPLDCSHGKYAGWETNSSRRQVWPVINWNKGKSGMHGLGDEGTTGNSDGGYIPTTSGTDWGSIFASSIPGIFGAVEKIAIQTTQKPGIQTVGPNGTSSSYVLPNGGTLALPNITGSLSGSSNLLVYGAVGLAVLFVISKMSK